MSSIAPLGGLFFHKIHTLPEVEDFSLHYFLLIDKRIIINYLHTKMVVCWKV